MSNGTITFANNVGRFDLDVTTFQMAVLFAWNQRPAEKVSYENLRLATELPGWQLSIVDSFFSISSNPFHNVFSLYLCFRSGIATNTVVTGSISQTEETGAANGSSDCLAERFY